MAISIKLLRTGSAASQNTFVVTAGTGDSGKLQIQYNSSDIYNNLSGSTSDILSGAANTTLTIPLNSANEIPKGVYYFNFVADVGSSDTSTINFQADSRTPILAADVDVYAPSFRIDDDTSYTVDNGTVSAATRTLTLQYPQTSLQSNLSASASDTTTDLYISTSNVWTGAMQTTQTYDVTYTIAATTGYDTFTYQESGTGYNSTNIDADTTLDPLYSCIENLRQQVETAQSKKRNEYAELLSDYTYVMSLVTQFREAVYTNNTTALDDIIAEIKAVTKCSGSSNTSTSTASKKLYGIGGNSESVQDIVGAMLEDATHYGINATYNDSTDTLSLEGRALFLNVYNDTGSTLSKGKAVYITGYDSGTGLPEVSLASNASAASAEAIGLVYADIASAASGRALISGWFEEVDTSSFSIGDELYLSTSGDLTATDPAPNAISQRIAVVGEAAAAGQMIVQVGSPKNLNDELSAATVITDLQTNMSKVEINLSAASQIEDLDTSSIEILAGTAGRAIQIHSAILVQTVAPTAGAQLVNFTIVTGTASGQAFAAANALWHTQPISSTVANTAGADAIFPLQPSNGDPATGNGNLGDGIYLSNSDVGGTYTNWASATAKLIVFYSQYTPS